MDCSSDKIKVKEGGRSGFLMTVMAVDGDGVVGGCSIEVMKG